MSKESDQEGAMFDSLERAIFTDTGLETAAVLLPDQFILPTSEELGGRVDSDPSKSSSEAKDYTGNSSDQDS